MMGRAEAPLFETAQKRLLIMRGAAGAAWQGRANSHSPNARNPA